MTTIARNPAARKPGSEIRHERIMASAGSGKTFQLTNRYLRLILDHADPGSILASTFTRLAAGEIRDRILERLAEATVDDAKRRELAEHTGVADLSRSDALGHLVQLTRRLHQLQVRTIDSFFAGIVRCFALELGLDPAATIIDEDTERQFRREAITRMLDETDPQPMIDLLRVLTEGETSRSVTDSIDSLVVQLYDLYRDAPPPAWEVIEPVPMLSRSKVIDAAASLHDGDVETTHKSVVKAHLANCQRARTARYDSYEDWLEFLGKGIACTIATGKETYYKQHIPAPLVSLYQPLIDHGLAVIHNSVVNRTRAVRELLDRFHRCFVEIKSANKALTFSDITWKMAEAERLGTLDEICFRLDATLRHMLLDEMQDTNIAQWRALHPLVSEIISYAPPERSFFCVGDVKQSIYGWREACPEILESLCSIAVDSEGNSAIAGDRQLAKSWRSSPVIMNVVNRVLMHVQHNPAMERCGEAAQLWDAAYVKHETARKNLPGYVELRAASQPPEGQSQERARLREAAHCIRQLHEQCPGASIGVLTRRNRTVNTLLYELGPSRLNVPASGRGGGALTDSAAVNVILDLLRLADHPDHTIAAFNVIHSPLGEIVGLRSMADCRRVSSTVRRQVLERGFAPTIQRWVRDIGSLTDNRQFRRLVQLQQLAAEFDQKPTLRCDDFLDMAEFRRVDDPSARPVQVMTVHQSKGLEFDIVVLPELEGDIVRSKPTMLYRRDGAAGPIECIARHLHKDVTCMMPELAAMHDAHCQRCARESLCLLYVAMTRARHALHMIINPPRENERTLPKTLAGLVRSALVEDDIEPGTVLYADGDAGWYGNVETAKCRNVESEDDHSEPNLYEAGPPPLAPSRGMPRGRTSVAASAHHGSESLAAQLRMYGSEARERGSVIHIMFEQITWLDDWQADRASLAARALREAPRRGEAWANEQVDAFLTMLAQPKIKAALSRGDATAEELQLYREFPFARLVDGAVQLGYIDRLGARVVDGQVVDATIIDYKTDDILPEQVSQRAETYRSQLETYRSAAASALGIAEERIAMLLLFTTCGEVAQL